MLLLGEALRLAGMDPGLRRDDGGEDNRFPLSPRGFRTIYPIFTSPLRLRHCHAGLNIFTPGLNIFTPAQAGVRRRSLIPMIY